jgi:DNA-binding GntR family transcriptional regulator
MESNIFKYINRQDGYAGEIFGQISNAILLGKLNPGDKLIEERLAEQFGVSRIPIRDALRHLEQLGLVEKIPYKGNFVSKLEEDEIIELHSLRRVLEGMAIKLITERKDTNAIKTLGEIIDKMKKLAETGDRRMILILDADFHDAIIHNSGHSLLNDVWSLVSLKMRRFLLLKIEHTHNTIEEVVDVHLKILNAIESGDPQIAEKEIINHLLKVEKKFKTSIKNGDPIIK